MLWTVQVGRLVGRWVWFQRRCSKDSPRLNLIPNHLVPFVRCKQSVYQEKVHPNVLANWCGNSRNELVGTAQSSHRGKCVFGWVCVTGRGSKVSEPPWLRVCVCGSVDMKVAWNPTCPSKDFVFLIRKCRMPESLVFRFFFANEKMFRGKKLSKTPNRQFTSLKRQRCWLFRLLREILTVCWDSKLIWCFNPFQGKSVLKKINRFNIYHSLLCDACAVFQLKSKSCYGQ
jgi:hypothetical protein